MLDFFCCNGSFACTFGFYRFGGVGILGWVGCGLVCGLLQYYALIAWVLVIVFNFVGILRWVYGLCYISGAFSRRLGFCYSLGCGLLSL